MSRLSSCRRLSTIASVVISVSLLHLEKSRWTKPVLLRMIAIAWLSNKFWLFDMQSHCKLLTSAIVLKVSPEMNMHETKLQKVNVRVLPCKILMMSLSVTSVFWALFWGFKGDTSNLEIIPLLAPLPGTPENAILFLFRKVSRFLPLNRFPRTVWLWGSFDFCWILRISAWLNRSYSRELWEVHFTEKIGVKPDSFEAVIKVVADPTKFSIIGQTQELHDSPDSLTIKSHEIAIGCCVPLDFDNEGV